MYVKVINKGSGLPQRFTQKVWDTMNTSNPKQAAKYEFLHQCDANGNALTETSKPNVPSDVVEFEKHVKDAGRLIQDKKYEQAKESLELAKKISPDSEVVRTMFNHIETAENMEREFEAEALMRDADEAKQEARLEDAKALIEKAMSLYLDPETGRKALEEIEALIIARDEMIAKVETLTANATKAIEEKRLDDARGILDELLTIDSESDFAIEQSNQLNELIAARDQAIAAYGGDAKDSKKGKKK